MKKPIRRSLATAAVHAGERVMKGAWTPVATPIHPSVAFTYDHMVDLDAAFDTSSAGYVYARHGSPTQEAFEAAMAELEGGEVAYAFASGMAALHAALIAAGAVAGAHIAAAVDLYGATHAMLRRLFADMGMTIILVDVADMGQVESVLMNKRPVALLVETISNPLLKIADVPTLAEICHRFGAALLVDNTFATPLLFNPLTAGADYCIHSATKYIGGHGDVTVGVVIADGTRAKRLDEVRRLAGATLSPFDAWLALRGLKTMPLRVERQCRNAFEIASWLSDQESVRIVNYPGLSAHPQHDMAAALFGARGFGGILSFELRDADRDKVFSFMDSLELCLRATTLGDVYTLVLHPATASHRSLSAEERERVGIHDSLIRLSAGIEDVQDILGDLEQALRRL
jgi:cystathionine beta-lyase/cystathionine gamma-synthase